jgi:hypothetical protein
MQKLFSIFNLSERWRQCLLRAVAVLSAAVALCWPALLLGSPLWSPDSVVYFSSGSLSMQRFLHPLPFSLAQPRSVIYSLGIYLLHRNVWAWPVVALSALLTAWTIWLVIRSLGLRRPVAVYLGVVVLLCSLTTVSWYLCLLGPDILGAVLFLCLYLLVFARESLQRWETVAVSVVVIWTVSAHPTFPALACGVVCFLGLLGLVRWRPMRGCWVALGQVSVLLALGMMTQVVANKLIFGEASLLGDKTPRIMARFLTDGPAKDYLHGHCGELHWTICRLIDKPMQNEEDFLWATDGIYQSATPAERADLQKEEIPLVLATLRTYPMQQAKRSWNNFIAELLDFGAVYINYDNAWMLERLDSAVPGARERYLRTKRVLLRLPLSLLGRIYGDGLPASAAVIAVLLPWVWRRRQNRMLGLTVVIGFVVVVNAMLTGVLSTVDVRYSGRIVWLLPMLAVLMRVGLGESGGGDGEGAVSNYSAKVVSVEKK